MGGGRFGALSKATRFNDNDRFYASSRTCRRHELAGVFDALDIKQDGTSIGIDGEIVEHVGNVDVELISDGDHSREADLTLSRPVDHASSDRAGLRNQRK